MKLWICFWIAWSVAFVVFGVVCLVIGSGNPLIQSLCVVGQLCLIVLNARRYRELSTKESA